MSPVDPFRWAKSQKTARGSLPISALLRLQDMLAETHGEITYSLRFYRDDKAQALVDCQLSGTLSLTCQRCLTPFSYDIALHTTLAPVLNTADLQTLADGYEPFLLQSGTLNIQDLIEETVLLDIPIIPKHADLNCIPLENQAYYGPLEADSKGAHAPFLTLAEHNSKKRTSF